MSATTLHRFASYHGLNLEKGDTRATQVAQVNEFIARKLADIKAAQGTAAHPQSVPMLTDLLQPIAALITCRSPRCVALPIATA
jgi:hypothetical protein